MYKTYLSSRGLKRFVRKVRDVLETFVNFQLKFRDGKNLIFPIFAANNRRFHKYKSLSRYFTIIVSRFMEQFYREFQRSIDTPYFLKLNNQSSWKQ